MTFKRMRRGLIAELNIAKNQKVFQDASKRQAALAKYPNPFAVYQLFNGDMSQLWEEKEKLLVAIIEEQQKSRYQLWNTLLIVIFYPMLSRLRRRLKSYSLTQDDLDQIVITTFLECVGKFTIHDNQDRLCLRLRQVTQRSVFKKLKKHHAQVARVRPASEKELTLLEKEMVFQDDLGVLAMSQYITWPENKTQEKRVFDAEEQEALIAFLEQAVGDEIEPDQLELIIVTQIHGEKLSDYVRRQYSGLSDEDLKKVYQRLKRRHSRALVKARKILNGNSSYPQFLVPSKQSIGSCSEAVCGV